MARRPRNDAVGSLHHVMNRAVGRRTLFEGESDIREFLACVNRSVDRGEIRLHAFTFLTTHFHLLVESVTGEMGHAFRCVESEYVRHFNRGRKRDGPLVRGRFFSKRVGHTGYWARVIRYIDDNPIAAGLVASAEEYPYGSAACYARAAGPEWLDRRAVERYVCAVRGIRIYDPRQYPLVFPTRLSESQREWIERRIARGDRHPDHFADLFMAAPAAVREVLTRQSLVADGTHPGVPLLDVHSVIDAVQRAATAGGAWRIGSAHHARDGWDVLTVGLLRAFCAERLESLSTRTGRPTATVRCYIKAHQALLRELGEYADRAHEVARSAVQGFAAGLPSNGGGLPDLRTLLAS